MAAADTALDELFQALAHPVRRRAVERLARGPASVSELAADHPMALPSFVQHLQVLESAGLVESEKSGRVRTVRLRAAALRVAEGWLAGERAVWERRLNQLDAHRLRLEREAERR